ncbi:inter-alpha-trypsin inhibitor heavy chain H6 isoform X2 [Betta splendens]|nr:inter-alpha-trypsin inhibitor heavy chain H6 isoform X2 [Betta splendens]
MYVAQVKERSAARKIYDSAKKQGKAAGLVATKERETERFRVAVSVPSGAHMSFSLTYEELLPRRLGRYELSLGLRPGQLVQNLTLDVSIFERSGLGFVKVLPLRTSRLLSNITEGESDAPGSTHIESSPNCARVRYTPTLQQQNSISSRALDADFIIQYDVDLRDPLGEIQVYNGYFVHYFAPRGLPVVPKDVIFVIDISGSMIGTKMKQTKQAMCTILGDLREGDHFNIITFSDKVHTWKKGPAVRATRQNVKAARDYVKAIIAEGWTNINAALLSAAQLINPPSSDSSNHLSSRRVPLIIFLTDGEATIGVTAGDTILSNAKNALGTASLFGLAFGDDADFLLLKRLALDNRGVARMVYEDADAALQLKGFYDEIASPLLSDIQLTYLEDQAFDVTRSMFPNYFQGSELVVAGRVKQGAKGLKVSMSASNSKQRVELENSVLISNVKGNRSMSAADCSGDLEGLSRIVHRLWAYFTIKELLLAKINTNDPAAQRLLAEKATDLSLKYNFVTPVTSLVIVKPDTDEAAQSQTTEKPCPAATTATAATAAVKTASGAVKMLSSPLNLRPVKTKPHPPRPPQLRKRVIAPYVARAVLIPSKNTITSGPTKPLNDSVTDISPPPPTPVPPSPHVGKIAPSLLHALKTALPPAPAHVSTHHHSSTTSSEITYTTRPPPGSVRTAPAALPGRPLTSQLSKANIGVPPLRGVVSSKEAGIGTTSAPDAPLSEVTTALPELPSLLTFPTPIPVPAVEHNNGKPSSDPDVSIATLVSATFAPMPGATDGPRPWEAAGLLDYDATYDYDYDLNYDSWKDTADTESFVSTSKLNTIGVFSSSVDGDPHFVVELPKVHQSLCFTLDGHGNDVIRLLEDPDRGITVDGRLVEAPSKHNAETRPRTYFDLLTVFSVTAGSGGIMITVSLDAVVVEGEGRDTLLVSQQGSVTRQGVTVSVDTHRTCWIEFAYNVRFLILFHYYKHPSYLQMAHLGFYITEGQGLSALTQGLLGQFQHADMTVEVVKDDVAAVADQADKHRPSARGILKWGSEHMPVTLQNKLLKDTVRKRHLSKCWVVPKAAVQRLLGHSYQSYIVDRV